VRRGVQFDQIHIVRAHMVHARTRIDKQCITAVGTNFNVFTCTRTASVSPHHLSDNSFSLCIVSEN
jgi:hypothetical protein